MSLKNILPNIHVHVHKFTRYKTYWSYLWKQYAIPESIYISRVLNLANFANLEAFSKLLKLTPPPIQKKIIPSR